MVIRFHQKSAGTARRVEYSFAELGVGDLHHETNYRARGIEFAGIASRIAHFPQHGFVQMRQGVNLFAAVEMNAVDLVDDVTQQKAADHAVLHAFEHVGDDFALTAFFTFASQAAQIGKQAFAALTVRTDGFVLVDER